MNNNRNNIVGACNKLKRRLKVGLPGANNLTRLTKGSILPFIGVCCNQIIIICSWIYRLSRLRNNKAILIARGGYLS